MQSSEDGWVSTTTYHRSIRWMMDTPTKRRLVFLATVTVLAVLTYFSLQVSNELYSSTSCVTRSCFNSLHNNWGWWEAAGVIFRVTVVSGAIGLMIRSANSLHVVDDAFTNSTRWYMPKLRRQANFVIMWTRRILSVVTITCFVTSIVALMVLAEIAQH